MATGVWTPQFKRAEAFRVQQYSDTLASGRPYTAVFDNPEVNFSLVPGEKFNSFRGPTFKDVDLSVSREFHFGERYSVGFRAEAFNIFNHPNFQQNVVDNVQYIANAVGTNPEQRDGPVVDRRSQPRLWCSGCDCAEVWVAQFPVLDKI